MSDDAARYEFLPWVREGYQPPDAETLADPIPDPGALSVSLTLRGEGKGDSREETVSLDVDMYGPGDVVGIDGRQVVRMEPEPDTGDFAPNYFPMVEFDRPDLPWLFSPVSADGEGKLRPWFCLVVVEQQEGVELSASGEKPLPTLTIGGPADPARELPDPTNSWAWAHAQVVGAGSSGGDPVRDELEANSTKTVARLVAPRRLEPGKSYHACVVPTFEPGKLAGLGEEPYPESGGDSGGGSDSGSGDDSGGSDSGGESDGTRRSDDVAMAWSLDGLGDRIELPVYHSWEFSTGREGDFESLVRELEPEVLAGLGYRDVDASDPGVEALSTRRTPTDVRLEGALKSAELDRLRYPDEMRAELTALANADDPDGDGTPTFGPPTYGKYHADVSEIPDSGSSWVRELNVDPRHRIAAGFGAEVVRDQQEQLLGSAWDQVGEIRAANRLLRRARLAREASNRAHDELTDLSPAEAVSATAGMHDRARWNEKATTFRRAIEDSKLPAATVSRELRRLLRPDGPIAGRIGDAAPDQSEIVDAFDPASEGTSPVRIEREGFPDGARLLTPEKRDGYEYGGFAELCEVVGGQSGPSSPGPVLHDEAKTDGDELREECWSALEDARGVVQKTREGVEDPRLRAILADLAAELAVVGREEGGEFDGSNNLLAGVDETVEDGDDATRVVAFLGAVARAFETVSDAADGVERLADDLSPDDAAVVRGNFGDYRAACRTFEVALAARAFRQLRAVCAVVVGVPDDLPADGTGVEDVRVACRAVCGESASSPGGLVADLKTLVGQSSHARATDVMAEIRRLVAVTGDRLAELRESGAPVESAVTSWRDVNAVFDLLAATMGHSGRNAVRSRVAETVCPPYDDEPSAGEPIDLGRAKAALLDATDPERAVPRRISRRLGGATGGREDPLDEILAAPTFDEPMYEPLADLSQDYLLPGVGDVPRDSIGVLETNPEFVRSYMVGLNHEMAREFRWREYPTDMRGTYFDRFWGAEGAVPVPDDPADIEAIHTWGVGSDPKRLDAPLARDEDGDESSDGVGGGEGNVVLLIRGELLRRYPNTTIYAVKAAPGEEGDDGDDQTQTGRVPDLPTGTNDEAPDPTADDVAFPMFRGHLDSDVTFFGFDLGVDEARGTPGSDDELGWFFVVEEAPGEPRLGLDVSDGDVGTVPDGIRTGDGSTGGGGSGGIDAESGWAALSWGHVVGGAGEDPLSELRYIDTETAVPGASGWESTEDPAEWGKNGAHMAAITWQKPVRIAIHADDMLPADEDGGAA
ncbi:hypothetical protein [Halorussus caseinilyticus]|uniref:hypothetical protein n=1 Tax=Halorussus caseinilyticus TaxID=3034025 RepID=UPI0023E82787|nr:hypothetical protein [Halorussus sp. DT72]